MSIVDNAIVRDQAKEDADDRKVQIFERLRDSVDAICPNALHEAEVLRSQSPDRFERILQALIPHVGSDHFCPISATQFVEKLKEFVHHS